MSRHQCQADEDGGTGGLRELQDTSADDRWRGTESDTAQKDHQTRLELSKAAAAAWEFFFRELDDLTTLLASPSEVMGWHDNGALSETGNITHQRATAAIAAFVSSEGIAAAGCVVPAADLLALLANEAVAAVRRTVHCLWPMLHEELQSLARTQMHVQGICPMTDSGRKTCQFVTEQCMSSTSIHPPSTQRDPPPSDTAVTELGSTSQPSSIAQLNIPLVWLEEEDDSVACERQPAGQCYSCRATPGDVGNGCSRSIRDSSLQILQPACFLDDAFAERRRGGNIAGDQRRLGALQAQLAISSAETEQGFSGSKAPPDTKHLHSYGALAAEYQHLPVLMKAERKCESPNVAEEGATNNGATKRALRRSSASKVRSKAELRAFVNIAEWRFRRTQRQMQASVLAGWRACCPSGSRYDGNAADIVSF